MTVVAGKRSESLMPPERSARPSEARLTRAPVLVFFSFLK